MFLSLCWLHHFVVFYSENSIALTSETEDNTFNEELNEPIYVNINSKKQTNPIPLCDLYDVILKYRENGMAGFKTEFDVSLLSGLVVQLVRSFELV